MTKFIKNILFFSLLIISIALLLNYFQKQFNKNPQHYEKQFLSVNKDTSAIDGIILGTSHATHSIRPSYLDKSNLTFYNYALNGANPEYYYNWYNKVFLPSHKKPQYCLFAVDFFMFDSLWLWRRFEQDSEYFKYSTFWKELSQNDSVSKKDLLINRYPFFKYRTQIFHSLRLKNGDPFFKINTYDRGYISYSTDFDKKNYTFEEKVTIDTTQVKYFKTLLKQMKSNDINIIFVMTPEYNVESYENMESLKIIKEISKRFNIPFLNYNTKLQSSINKNIDLFSDWGHMNAEGSKVFSDILAEDLRLTIKNNSSKPEQHK